MKISTRSIRTTIQELTLGTYRISRVKNDGSFEALPGGADVINDIMKDIPIRSLRWQTKASLSKRGIRVVKESHVRFGAYIAPGVVLMPFTFVNIGAWVGENTMIDTGATIGAGAQIGSNVHISGKVSIGGVLEPRQAKPVIIEDGCFIGALSAISEGAHIGQNAVIAAHTTLNSSIKIFDVRGAGKPKELPKGYIPPNVVVVPATYKGRGGFSYPCVVIYKDVSEGTKTKTKINTSLRG